MRGVTAAGDAAGAVPGEGCAGAAGLGGDRASAAEPPVALPCLPPFPCSGGSPLSGNAARDLTAAGAGGCCCWPPLNHIPQFPPKARAERDLSRGG